MFSVFCSICGVCLVKFLVCWSQNCVFLASPCKTMQNHLDISSNSQFWITYFFRHPFLSKIIVIDLQTTFFDGQTVFFRASGRNTLEKGYKITSKSKFSTHFVQIPYHLHPALCSSLDTRTVTAKLFAITLIQRTFFPN